MAGNAGRPRGTTVGQSPALLLCSELLCAGLSRPGTSSTLSQVVPCCPHLPLPVLAAVGMLLRNGWRLCSAVSLLGNNSYYEMRGAASLSRDS